jgi:hypothetical protein
MSSIFRFGYVCLILVALTQMALAADPLTKREKEAAVGKLRGQVSLLVKKLPADYRYADPDAEGAAPEAVSELRALSEPLVADALIAMFPREKNPHVRKLFVELAAGFRQRTKGFLVKTALTDREPEIRRQALQTWERIEAEDVLSLANVYVHDEKMRYAALDALNDSGVLDRVPEEGTACQALVETLLKNLYRADKSLVAVDSAAVARTGSDVRRIQRRDAAVVVKSVPDPVVHSVLTRVTKQDFEYDLQRWNRWFAIRFK